MWRCKVAAAHTAGAGGRPQTKVTLPGWLEGWSPWRGVAARLALGLLLRQGLRRDAAPLCRLDPGDDPPKKPIERKRALHISVVVQPNIIICRWPNRYRFRRAKWTILYPAGPLPALVLETADLSAVEFITPCRCWFVVRMPSGCCSRTVWQIVGKYDHAVSSPTFFHCGSERRCLEDLIKPSAVPGVLRASTCFLRD